MDSMEAGLAVLTLLEVADDECPDKTLKTLRIGDNSLQAPSEAAAKKAFEDAIDKQIEGLANLNCKGKCTRSEASCVFDYKVGPIKITVLVEPGETKKHKVKIPGTYECEAWVSVGCYCVVLV